MPKSIHGLDAILRIVGQHSIDQIFEGSICLIEIGFHAMVVGCVVGTTICIGADALSK